MISVIIFSDIRIYCEGLSDVLSNIESIEVVGSESHFRDAIDKIVLVNPNVILLDMTMEGSCQIAQKIIQSSPQTRIVALAAPVDKEKVLRCAEIGISGYVAREASLNELIEALKAAAKGEYCYPPKFATHIFNQFREVSKSSQQHHQSSGSTEIEDLAIDLTGREKQITRLLSEGLSNKQIARLLSIEVSTVKNHVHNILVKLHVKNRAQVASIFYNRVENQGSRSFGLHQNNYLTV